MRILRTITDKDLGLNFSDPGIYQERVAGRAIVFDSDKKIALLHATKKGYHKLPGGGVEAGEDIIQATKREAIEEIGCDIEIIKEVGTVEEYRNKYSLHQLSHCFVAKIIGAKGIPNFVAVELADGFEPVWVTMDEAIKILESESNVEDYQGRFIQVRDLLFLKEVSKKQN